MVPYTPKGPIEKQKRSQELFNSLFGSQYDFLYYLVNISIKIKKTNNKIIIK